MQITGMLYGGRLLEFAGFPATEVLGPAASEEEIKAMIDKFGLVFIKPVFKGGIGKKGKAGLLGRASDLQTALAEKERLYFAQHQVGHAKAKANGVTFEARRGEEGAVLQTIRGTVDRITGKVDALETSISKNNTLYKSYDLRCKRTKPLF